MLTPVKLQGLESMLQDQARVRICMIGGLSTCGLSWSGGMRCLNRQARRSSCCGLSSSSSGTASVANSCTTIGMTTYVSESVKKDLQRARASLSSPHKGSPRWTAEMALLITLCLDAGTIISASQGVRKELEHNSVSLPPAAD